MEHDKKNKEIWFDYNNIWSKIESLFHLNHDDVKSIMKVWLEDTYKLDGVTLRVAETLEHMLLGEHYKFNIV
jgi:hypothetical protein